MAKCCQTFQGWIHQVCSHFWSALSSSENVLSAEFSFSCRLNWMHCLLLQMHFSWLSGDFSSVGHIRRQFNEELLMLYCQSTVSSTKLCTTLKMVMIILQLSCLGPLTKLEVFWVRRKLRKQIFCITLHMRTCPTYNFLSNQHIYFGEDFTPNIFFSISSIFASTASYP